MLQAKVQGASPAKNAIHNHPEEAVVDTGTFFMNFMREVTNSSRATIISKMEA